jgi:Na+-driven multidrug efflux pump
VLIAVRPLVLSIYNLSSIGRSYAMRLMILSGVFLWARSANFTIFIGILRSGGDTKFAMVAELASVWLIGVPLALIGGLVLHLPVYYVYPMVACEELVKLAISFRRYRSMKWVNNLVADELVLEAAV